MKRANTGHTCLPWVLRPDIVNTGLDLRYIDKGAKGNGAV